MRKDYVGLEIFKVLLLRKSFTWIMRRSVSLVKRIVVDLCKFRVFESVDRSCYVAARLTERISTETVSRRSSASSTNHMVP
jgi:hypothetical protein